MFPSTLEELPSFLLPAISRNGQRSCEDVDPPSGPWNPDEDQRYKADADCRSIESQGRSSAKKLKGFVGGQRRTDYGLQMVLCMVHGDGAKKKTIESGFRFG